VINGSQIPASGIQSGPVICKTKGPTDYSPDLFFCSKPNQVLAISVTTPGQHAYVANQLGNSISVCQVNPATGLLSHCAIAATGLDGVEGVGFNPSGILFYSANLAASSISLCHVNQSTGALNGCINAGGTGFSQPDAVAFSPDGSIFYTSNVGGSVSACLVNSVTGQLSACVNNTSPSFSAPADMMLNASGTFAYVANRGNSTVSVCNVFGQVVTSCNNFSGSLFDQPEGITLDPLGLHAYITNAGNGQVILCDIRQDGTGLLNNCSATNGPFHGTGNIGLNKLGTFAYVPNQLINIVSACQAMLSDGTLSNCIPSLGTGFNGPSGIVIH
jgi:DNA-binding beta-propeller fold protein YncE